MSQTANTILNLLTFVIFCYILSDQHLVNGQAYHFSKGWMPGKRTNILLQPSQFGEAEELDGLSEEDRDGAGNYDDEQRLDVIAKMMTEPTTESGEYNQLDNDHHGNDMARLRTLLRTLPRIQSLSSTKSSALLPYPSSYSHTPPQCQIRPHLTRLIETLLEVSIYISPFVPVSNIFSL